MEGFVCVPYIDHVSGGVDRHGRQPAELTYARINLVAQMLAALNQPQGFRDLERTGVIRSMPGDGDCFFHAVSEQLYGAQRRRHRELRQGAVRTATTVPSCYPRGWLTDTRKASLAVAVSMQEKLDIEVLYSGTRPHRLALDEYAAFMGLGTEFATDEEIKSLCVSCGIAIHIIENHTGKGFYGERFYCDNEQVAAQPAGSDDAIPHVWVVWRGEHFWSFYADAADRAGDPSACIEAVLAASEKVAKVAGHGGSLQRAVSDNGVCASGRQSSQAIDICYALPGSSRVDLLDDLAAWAEF